MSKEAKDIRPSRTIYEILSQIWFLLPLWLFTLNALSIFDGMMKCSSPYQRGLSWIVIFPLAASILSFLARFLRTYRGKEKWKQVNPLALFFSLVFILLALTAAGWGEDHSGKDLHLWFEVSTGLAFFLYVIHSLTYEGRDKTISLFGIGLIYGLILENSGVLLGFFTEEQFHVYIPYLPAPFFTALGWCNVFYSCRFLVLSFLSENKDVVHRGIIRGRWGRGRLHVRFAFLLTLFALLLDLQLDPFATYHKLWIWNDTLKDFFGGVPLINFTAWVSAIFPFSLIFSCLETREKTGGGKVSLRLLTALPIILFLASVMVLSWTTILEGIHSSAMKIFMERFTAYWTFLFQR